jgi:tetratricopeptide (TPR) repeat protein
MGKTDPAKLAKMFVEFASAERTSNVDMNFLVICTLFEEAIGKGWLSEEQRKLFADRYKTLTAEQQWNILHMLRQQIALRDVTPPGQRSPVSDFLDYIEGRAGEETANRCRELIDGGRELEKSTLLLLNPIMCEDLMEASAKSVQMDAKEKQIWIKAYRELKQKYEAKFPLYLHTRASRAYHNATIRNDEYRERLLKPERACLERLLFGDNSGRIPSREEFDEPTPLPPETSRKGMNHFIALGSGTGLIEFANFVVPYSNRFLSTGFKLFCVDTAAHPISMVGLEEILDGKFALQQDATDRFRVQNKNELTHGGFNNCVRKVSANIINSRKLRDALEEAIGDDDKDQFGNRPHSTYLLLGRTFGNFDDNIGLLDSIYDTMLPGDELVFSVSTVLSNEDGTKDIESMKLPYKGTYVTEFLTEISMLAGWMDRTVSLEYQHSTRTGREDDVDMLVFKVGGYCTQTASTVEEQVLISKRYDISRRRNQLEEIVRRSKFRHTDVKYVGVDDADKTGVAVAYARKTRSSVWVPKLKVLGGVVCAVAAAAAIAGGAYYLNWLDKGEATPEKAEAMACSSDQDGLCYLSGRQDDSTQLLDMVLAAECGLDKVYPAAARVIECAGGMDPDRIDSLRRQLFDKMKSDHFLLFAVERHGIIELFKELESQGSSKTSLEELIAGVPPEMRMIADMTTQYEITRTLDITEAKAKIDRLPDTAGNVEAIVNFAYLNNRRGELDDAINYYERALNITKSTGVTRFVCFEDNNCFTATNILHMLMDAAAAERDFAAVNRHLDEFRSNVENGCGWDNYALAHIHLRMREYGTALAQFDKGLRWERAQQPRVPALQGWTYHKFADLYSEKGLFDDAVRYAREGILLFKGVGDEIGAEWCNIALARALINKGGAGDAEAALDALDNIQQLSHDENARIYALFNKGRAYMRLGDIKSARAEFNTASDVVNSSEGDSMRRHYDLFMAEYWTGLNLFAGSNSSSQALPHFTRAYSHLNVLISKTREDMGDGDFFAIEELACLRFIDEQRYVQRKEELTGFILDHRGLFNEFLLDQYGD